MSGGTEVDERRGVDSIEGDEVSVVVACVRGFCPIAMNKESAGGLIGCGWSRDKEGGS